MSVQLWPQGLKKMSLVAVCACLGACAPKSYVVLLENPEGGIGQVTVSNKMGQAVLTKAENGLGLDRKPTEIFKVSKQQLQQDFGDVLKARPMLPESFMLYFLGGNTDLTSASVDLLPKIKAAVLARATVDVSVIGHTDTVGDDQLNTRLALKRAEFVSSLFAAMNAPVAAMTITSHGEKNLLVKTPDNTPEPLNRRVEVTLR